LGIVESVERADQIVRTLRNAGFPTSAISLPVSFAPAATGDESTSCGGPLALGDGTMSARSGALAWRRGRAMSGDRPCARGARTV
jgi:hypothetical protein